MWESEVFRNKDALALDLRACGGSTVTGILEGCNRIWTTNIVLPKLFLFICLHSLWFYKLKRSWPKPVETVESIKPFHLFSPCHRCYRKRNKYADKASQLHFPGLRVFPVQNSNDCSYFYSTCIDSTLQRSVVGVSFKGTSITSDRCWPRITWTALVKADVQLSQGSVMALGGKIRMPGFETHPPHCHILNTQSKSAPHK